MHVDHIRPVRPAHLVEDDVAQDAGVVDQDVDAAEGVERGLDDQVGVLRLGDGERGGDGLAAGLLDGRDRILRRTVVGARALQAGADVADHHARAFAREHLGDGAADAAAGAGDDGDFFSTIPGIDVSRSADVSADHARHGGHPVTSGRAISETPGYGTPGLTGTTAELRPTPPGRLRRSCAASPIARPRPACCLPRLRQSRIAATGKAGRAKYISSPRRCGA